MRTTDVGAWATSSSLWNDPPPSSLALLLIVAGYRVSLFILTRPLRPAGQLAAPRPDQGRRWNRHRQTPETLREVSPNPCGKWGCWRLCTSVRRKGSFVLTSCKQSREKPLASGTRRRYLGEEAVQPRTCKNRTAARARLLWGVHRRGPHAFYMSLSTPFRSNHLLSVYVRADNSENVVPKKRTTKVIESVPREFTGAGTTEKWA